MCSKNKYSDMQSHVLLALSDPICDTHNCNLHIKKILTGLVLTYKSLKALKVEREMESLERLEGTLKIGLELGETHRAVVAL